MNEKHVCPNCGGNSVKAVGKDSKIKAKHTVLKCYDCNYTWIVFK
jgi:transposase-like protein